MPAKGRRGGGAFPWLTLRMHYTGREQNEKSVPGVGDTTTYYACVPVPARLRRTFQFIFMEKAWKEKKEERNAL